MNTVTIDRTFLNLDVVWGASTAGELPPANRCRRSRSLVHQDTFNIHGPFKVGRSITYLTLGFTLSTCRPD